MTRREQPKGADAGGDSFPLGHCRLVGCDRLTLDSLGLGRDHGRSFDFRNVGLFANDLVDHIRHSKRLLPHAGFVPFTRENEIVPGFDLVYEQLQFTGHELVDVSIVTLNRLEQGLGPLHKVHGIERLAFPIIRHSKEQRVVLRRADKILFRMGDEPTAVLVLPDGTGYDLPLFALDYEKRHVVRNSLAVRSHLRLSVFVKLSLLTTDEVSQGSLVVDVENAEQLIEQCGIAVLRSVDQSVNRTGMNHCITHRFGLPKVCDRAPDHILVTGECVQFHCLDTRHW